MVRAYLLLEVAPDKLGAVRDSVGHGLGNCLAIAESLWPSEVIVHIQCDGQEYLQRAVIEDIARMDGVKRITTCLIVREDGP